MPVIKFSFQDTQGNTEKLSQKNKKKKKKKTSCAYTNVDGVTYRPVESGSWLQVQQVIPRRSWTVGRAVDISVSGDTEMERSWVSDAPSSYMQSVFL